MKGTYVGDCVEVLPRSELCHDAGGVVEWCA